MSEFLLPTEEYTRDLNVLKHYVEDMAFYLSRQTGKPEAWCQAYVKKQIGKDGKFPINNPEVTMIAKDAKGDRFVGKTGYLNYLKNIQEKNLIAAPSMTTYLQPEESKSLVGLYIAQNLALRKEAKHEMFVAEMGAEGAKTEEEKIQFEQIASIKNNEQTSHKIFNNGVSGAQSIGSTPLALVSAHSTLTSGCRTATSYANATIERFQAGLRHYWSGECVRTNIVAVIRQANHPLIVEVMGKYNLRAPTVEETMATIRRSTDQYWKNDVEMDSLHSFVEKMSDHERAAYCYSGDMYTMRLYNEEFIRNFFAEMTSPKEIDVPDPIEASKKLKGDEQILSMFLCAEQTFGKTLGDMAKNNEVENLRKVVCTYTHVKNTVAKYSDFFKAFYVTRSLPGNISYTRDIRRGAVVGSDTDSSLFNSRRWVKWYHGTVKFDWESQKVWHCMVYLTCQVVAHSLALLSGGMGVKAADLFKLAMKNEYAFPVFALTPIAKHYFASMSAREGNIYKKFKKETKGVGFVDSNSPPEIVAECGGYIDMILNEIYETGNLRAIPILKSMANTERSVIESVKRGESAYLKRVYVKDKSSYKKPMSSVYRYHDLWESAFSHLYGPAPALPYRGVRIAADLGNKTAIQEWLMTIKDDKCRKALEDAFLKPDAKGATKIESFVLPLDIVERQGIPEEILEAVNLRKLAYGICSPFYLLSSTLGIEMVNKKYTRLLSDML